MRCDALGRRDGLDDDVVWCGVVRERRDRQRQRVGKGRVEGWRMR